MQAVLPMDRIDVQPDAPHEAPVPPAATQHRVMSNSRCSVSRPAIYGPVTPALCTT